jgi:hypothetical protein
MSQSNILFFSQNCQYSKKLISKIINTPIYTNLQKVCIDDPQTRARLPKWVTCVPMIYLSQPHPSYQNPLKEQDLWMWLEQQLSQFQQTQQPPQQQFQNQQQQNNMRQQQPPQQQPQQQLQPQQNPTPGMGDNSMGFEPYNGFEMKGGIASDNYSLFFKDDANGAQNATLFQHTYETIGGPGPQQLQNNNSRQQQFSQPVDSNSRSSMKQDKFEQEFAMKKAMRDQDQTNAQPNRKMEGVPQNFNEMWDSQSRR